jgi:hypothetical protein
MNLFIIVPPGLAGFYFLKPFPVLGAIVVAPPQPKGHWGLAVVAESARDWPGGLADCQGFGAQLFFALAGFVNYVSHFYAPCCVDANLVITNSAHWPKSNTSSLVNRVSVSMWSTLMKYSSVFPVSLQTLVSSALSW